MIFVISHYLFLLCLQSYCCWWSISNRYL